jgi:hypothetical protein
MRRHEVGGFVLAAALVAVLALVRAEFADHLRHALSRPPDLSITVTTIEMPAWTWTTWTWPAGCVQSLCPEAQTPTSTVP